MLAALMQQLHLGRTQAGPSDTAPLPALQSIEQARPTLQSGGPSREAPRAPRAPHICGRCEAEQVHICLHSAVQSVRSDGSIGGQRPVEPQIPPGRRRVFPPPSPGSHLVLDNGSRTINPAERRRPHRQQLRKRHHYTTPEVSPLQQAVVTAFPIISEN